jgi:hypothetical protein
VTRFVTPVLALTLGLAAAFWVASCGGSNDQGLLPGDTASDIVANLNQVDDLASSGDCSGAVSAAAEVQSQVDNLGPQVDPELKQRLVEGAAQLTRVAAECAVETEATSDTTPTESTPETDTQNTETTKSTPTETTDTTPTQPPDTTPTQPPQTTPTAPPANGGGSGAGSGGSGGIGPGASGGTP